LLLIWLTFNELFLFDYLLRFGFKAPPVPPSITCYYKYEL